MWNDKNLANKHCDFMNNLRFKQFHKFSHEKKEENGGIKSQLQDICHFKLTFLTVLSLFWFTFTVISKPSISSVITGEAIWDH